MRICFDFDRFDWIHRFWDIGQKFPNLKATYMVATAGNFRFFSPDALFTNDIEGNYFKVEDHPVKIVTDLHELRQDCEVDNTNEMGRSICNDLEFCFPFEDDEDGDDMCLDS